MIVFAPGELLPAESEMTCRRISNHRPHFSEDNETAATDAFLKCRNSSKELEI